MDKSAVVAALRCAVDALEFQGGYRVRTKPADLLRTLAERIENGHEDEEEWELFDGPKMVRVLHINWSDEGSEG